jgi:hypothetical protein
VVEGQITVPNYLDRRAGITARVTRRRPLSRLYYPDGSDLPAQNPDIPWVQVPFTCHVPLGEGASVGALYGHGLLGTRSQIGDVKWPRRYGFAGCGVDWWGMSTLDLPTVATILVDLSYFPSLPDRGQQGFLNFMFVGRAMVHPDGFVADPAFQEDDAPLLVVDEGEGTQLHYDGNSQGGIMGGSLVAVSPDIHRGDPGGAGDELLDAAEPERGLGGRVRRGLLRRLPGPARAAADLQLIQMLWDRSESNGYAHHITTDPLPNTPDHQVMLQVAWSDHQVTNVAAEVMARTIGAPIMEGPAGRSALGDGPLPRAHGDLPVPGSALIYWDSGNATPPNGNVPATMPVTRTATRATNRPAAGRRPTSC